MSYLQISLHCSIIIHHQILPLSSICISLQIYLYLSVLRYLFLSSNLISLFCHNASSKLASLFCLYLSSNFASLFCHNTSSVLSLFFCHNASSILALLFYHNTSSALFMLLHCNTSPVHTFCSSVMKHIQILLHSSIYIQILLLFFIIIHH